MSSKETILAALRSAGAQIFEKPDLSSLKKDSLRYEDTLGQFCSSLAAGGGKVAFIGKSLRDGVEAYDSVEEAIKTLFPGEEDVAVVDGSFGVAENGCVWLTEPSKNERVDYFIHEGLAIILDPDALVDNMHDAYDRLGEKNDHYGIFISGPSKTADIEQSLVFGAHGSRIVAVIFRR